VKKFTAFCFLLLLSLPAAAVEDGQVMYLGGTAPGLKAGTMGQLDTTSDVALIFTQSASRLEIQYSSIQSFAYSSEVTRHLGVLPAIAVGLVRARKHRHFFRISYRDQNGVAQVAVFEVPKHMPLTLQAVLETRGPHIPKRSRGCGCAPDRSGF